MKRKLVFLCVGNSCRSQMAEGYAKKYFSDKWDIYSAGTHPAMFVAPYAVEVMREIGVDISSHRPKRIEELPIKEADVVVTMGCEVECPNFPHRRIVQWSIPDPIGHSIDYYRKVRDMIIDHIEKLFSELEKENS